MGRGTGDDARTGTRRVRIKKGIVLHLGGLITNISALPSLLFYVYPASGVIGREALKKAETLGKMCLCNLVQPSRWTVTVMLPEPDVLRHLAK